MGKESSLVWTPIQKELKERRWNHQRIEDKTMPGIPDVNIHFPLIGDVWLELKYVDGLPRNLVTGKVEIGLRPEQYIWLKEAREAGRNCFLVVRIGAGWYYWDDVSSWELAKHPASWQALARKAYKVANAPALIAALHARLVQP